MPIAQFLLALSLLLGGRHVQQPAGIDFPYSGTARAFSAPAFLLAIACDRIVPFDRPDRTPFSIVGFGSADLLFLLGVIVVWYLVGRAIDQKLSHQGPTYPRSLAGTIVLNVALIALGILLLLLGIAPVLYKQGYPTGAVVAGGLFLAWGGVLLFFPVINLRHALRSRSR